MRFLALLRKELRECLPWLLLAAIILLAIGGFILRDAQLHEWYRSSSRHFPSGSIMKWYDFTVHPPLSPVGPVLLLTSIGLGLALGARQFWVPHFTRTWGFTIHRSLTRSTILCAKFTAAVIAFVISLGAVWLALYWYSSRPQLFSTPPVKRVFIEGWLFILLGLVVYLGTALTGLSTARWYTSKIFGLAFAAIVIFPVILQWQLGWAFALIIISTLILLSQTINAFSEREF